jgi:hypothetical protein
MTFHFDHITYVVKSPAVNAILIVLMIIFTGAWMVGFWIQTGAIRDARESGHRYWLLNPLAILTGYRTMNWKPHLSSVFIGLLAALAAIFLIGLFASEPL